MAAKQWQTAFGAMQPHQQIMRSRKFDCRLRWGQRNGPLQLSLTSYFKVGPVRCPFAPANLSSVLNSIEVALHA